MADDDRAFDRVIEADSPDDAADQLADALGLEPGDTVSITTPQFDRRDDIEPAPAPVTSEGYDALEALSEDELKALGLRPWGDYGLWLLPHPWHPHIPDDYEVVDIFGEIHTRAEEPANPDKRFGCLAWGIIPDFEPLGYDDLPEESNRPDLERMLEKADDA